MNIEVIIPIGDLQREVWRFSLMVSYNAVIYFNSFHFQGRETKRCAWRNQAWWLRLDNRGNTIPRPEMPEDVIADMRRQITEKINEVKIDG